MSPSTPDIAIIGAGPAGLFAAEYLSARGHKVRVYDRMPTPGRKFLMAGRGGLNLTHSEEMDAFLSRYRPANPQIEAAIRAFPPAALREWCDDLGQDTFIGSSGRVFPKAMKASPLLRAWRARLEAQGVELVLRHVWTGWDGQGALTFDTPDGAVTVKPRATLLALGGASWPRLGSDGGWAGLLGERGVAISPFQPSNSGFHVDWSEAFRSRHAGTPLKHVTLSFGGRDVTGDAMISAYGIEGGGIYALSGAVREALASGPVTVYADLRPGVDVAALERRLASVRKGESMANRLRKAAGLSPVSAGLLREASYPLPSVPSALAALIKACPILLTGIAGLERAISSAGGIEFNALDERFMLKALPGVFAAGEMLDWEAPTGGYLLQACFATGLAAAKGIESRLSDR
ncbi:TIGR03862 family flavoprotein [Hyphobacterium sp. SN044]|uniref:TIGR03862 family flavoprotein n=1 Tax=Hyphobacterium sp. SN044 TaxID=2912575 RepID=UPI001F3D93E4|nr:TIGR03862 family flavoprotein [Hyphobacterium sp. SN044]MCF8878866.1 TIGR03862 family flavoprotein [Hyphobacterium sp. SN044]